MTYKEDILGALYLIATSFEIDEIRKDLDYHIVTFKNTTATLTIDAKEVTKEEIQATAEEARS